MTRTDHPNARWRFSPAELAETYTKWRIFRHLTYKAILSYIHAVYAREVYPVYDGSFRTYQEPISDDVFAIGANLFRAERAAAKRYGFPYFVSAMLRGNKLNHQWTDRYAWPVPLLEPNEVRNAARIPETGWAREPEDSVVWKLIAFRLGASCAVCGERVTPITLGRYEREWPEWRMRRTELGPLLCCKRCLTEVGGQPASRALLRMAARG